MGVVDARWCVPASGRPARSRASAIPTSRDSACATAKRLFTLRWLGPERERHAARLALPLEHAPVVVAVARPEAILRLSSLRAVHVP